MNWYHDDGDYRRGNGHRLQTASLIVFRIDDDSIGNRFGGCGRCTSAYESESEETLARTHSSSITYLT